MDAVDAVYCAVFEYGKSPEARSVVPLRPSFSTSNPAPSRPASTDGYDAALEDVPLPRVMLSPTHATWLPMAQA